MLAFRVIQSQFPQTFCPYTVVGKVASELVWLQVSTWQHASLQLQCTRTEGLQATCVAALKD